MTRGVDVLPGVLCVAALMLTGCAAVSPGASEPRRITAVEYECVPQSDGGAVELGATISVTRGPDGKCEGLTLGSVQAFELRSIHVADVVKVVTEVAVAKDGSFSFEVQVPLELRLGRAMLQAMPAVSECSDPGEQYCPEAPTVNFDVMHRASALRNVEVVSTGLATPPLPARALEEWSRPYYLPGPADGQVTLVLPGNGCETLPRYFVVDAPTNSLELVSEVRGDACPEIATRWTSIIDVPDEYVAFESVKVDNVQAELLSAGG